MLVMLFSFFILGGCSKKGDGIDYRVLKVNLSDAKSIGLSKVSDTENRLIKLTQDDEIEEITYTNADGKAVNLDAIPFVVENFGQFTGVLYVDKESLGIEEFINLPHQAIVNSRDAKGIMLKMFQYGEITHGLTDPLYAGIRLFFIHNETGKVFDFKTMLYEGEEETKKFIVKDFMFEDNQMIVSGHYHYDGIHNKKDIILKFTYDESKKKMKKESYNPKLDMNEFYVLYHDRFGNTIYLNGTRYHILKKDGSSIEFNKNKITNTLVFRVDDEIYLLQIDGTDAFHSSKLKLLKVIENGSIDEVFTLDLDEGYNPTNELLNLYFPIEDRMNDIEMFLSSYHYNFYPLLKDKKLFLFASNHRLQSNINGNIFVFDLEYQTLDAQSLNFNKIFYTHNQMYLFKINDVNGKISKFDLNTWKEKRLFDQVSIENESIIHDQGYIIMELVDQDSNKIPFYISTDTGEAYYNFTEKPTVEPLVLIPLK
jgi:hypothetical protein